MDDSRLQREHFQTKLASPLEPDMGLNSYVLVNLCLDQGAGRTVASIPIQFWCSS